MCSKYFEINLFEFKLLQYSWHQDWTLNSIHGQALATALKLNNTVVDINLPHNDCGDEGAEACEHT